MSFLNLKAADDCNCSDRWGHKQVKEPAAVQNDSGHPVTCPSTATEGASLGLHLWMDKSQTGEWMRWDTWGILVVRICLKNLKLGGWKVFLDCFLLQEFPGFVKLSLVMCHYRKRKTLDHALGWGTVTSEVTGYFSPPSSVKNWTLQVIIKY